MYQDYVLDRNGPMGISLQSWLEKERLAFIIVDMQNYMTEREYSSRWSADGSDDYYFSTFEKTVLPNIQKVIQQCRKRSIPIVYLRIAYRNRNLADVPAGVCRKRFAEDLYDANGRQYELYYDHPASQIDIRLKPEPEDIVIEKTSSGAFCSSDLDVVLRSRNIARLVFSGGLTDGCVESTIREAFDRGYLCTLLEDACITSRKELHDASVAAIRNYFGWVTTTADFLKKI